MATNHCCATTRRGERCKGPTCVGDQFCRWHGGRRRVPKVCRCSAYGWPHRPGSGRCRFYDPPDPPGVRVFHYTPSKPPGINKPLGLRRRGWSRFVQQYLQLHPIHHRQQIREVIEFMQAHPTIRVYDVWFWFRKPGVDLRPDTT